MTTYPLAPSKISRGMVDKPSNHSVDESVERLRKILLSKGITLFALVDHSGEAEKVGISIPSSKLFIFGSPGTGTALMQAAPRVAIDLPLKILIWEDRDGRVWVSYNTPSYLQERHNFPEELLKNIAAIEALASAAAD